MSKMNVVILAAGEGKRMKTNHSKVAHKILGKSVIEWAYNSFSDVEIDKCIVVVGHKADEVKEILGSEKFIYVEQKEQLGTGHAVMQASPMLKEDDSTTMVFYGDVPMVLPNTIKNVVEYHEQNKNSITVLTAEVPNPFNYGRIIKDENGSFLRIVEERDANDEEKKVREINSGLYCFNTRDLLYALKNIKNDNNQKEYYITDSAEILLNAGKKVDTYKVNDPQEILGINNKVQLADASQILQKRILNKHMLNGVTIISPDTVNIEMDVEIGKDTIIYPNTMLQGKTKIGEECEIGPTTTIKDTVLGNNTKIINSVIMESEIEDNVKIGPFSYIRPESHISKGVKIGDFVEVKKSNIGEGTKIAHLTYVGDCDVGKNVNFGCGTVIVNYDGKKKYRSKIGNNVFIGCNSNIVSPVEIKDNAYTAAGSTITNDVPEYALAIARERQINKEDWVKRKEEK